MKTLIKVMVFTAATFLLTLPLAADDNVVMILDTSLSMSENMSRGQSKMEAAQQAILQVLKGMPKSTNLGIVTFDGWIVALNRVDLNGASNAVLSTQPAGRTPLGHFLKEGADALLKKRAEAHGLGTYTLLVVTDGEATDQVDLDRYVPDVLSRGITLKTIGIRMAQDHTLKHQSVAYYQGNDLPSLQTAIATAIAEISGSTDGGPSEDEYAMIRGLPDQVATEIIKTLANANTLNHPIGERVPIPGPQGDTVIQVAGQTPDVSGFWVGLLVFGFLIVVVGLVFVWVQMS